MREAPAVIPRPKPHDMSYSFLAHMPHACMAKASANNSNAVPTKAPTARQPWLGESSGRVFAISNLNGTSTLTPPVSFAKRR